MRINTFGSICSGIEAASFVMGPLGVRPLWVSEIAEFPKRFLSHSYSHIKNLGDMNDIPHLIDEGKVEVPDFLCGGTPCQAFSLAGWKNGLNDDRGQLTLKYIDILNALDRKRESQNREGKTIFFWENVEGVLKDKTNAFGHFLAGLLDLDEPIVSKKWPNAGVIFGRQRNIAWRVVDAKYFGVPQQRKRLYVVGGGVDFNPANILFENGEWLADPYLVSAKKAAPSLFEEDIVEERPLIENKGSHIIEVFRQYSDCLYAAYGTKWNGNAASFNGSLFVCQNGRVRRLTPKECERLMGFPDDYTNIAPDVKSTNRYQAIGNSWAVPVVSWIITRILYNDKTPVSIPESSIVHKDKNYKLYFFDGFVKDFDQWLNTSAYPYDYKLSHMLDIIDTDAEEKYYLSAAGCAGIVRRKEERNCGINERLEFHLRNGFNNNTELLKKTKVPAIKEFEDEEIGLSVKIFS